MQRPKGPKNKQIYAEEIIFKLKDKFGRDLTPTEGNLYANAGHAKILNEEVKNKICALLREGASYKDAAILAGTALSTLDRWRRTGKQLLKEYDELTKKQDVVVDYETMHPYAQLVVDFEQAKIDAKMFHVKNIKEHSRSDWKASAWILERRHRDEYGKEEKITHAGNAGMQVNIIPSSKRKKK